MPVKKLGGAAANKPVRWSLPRGRLLRRTLRTDTELEYSVYIPTTGGVDAPVLVAAHGMSRTWNGQAEAFTAGCEQLGITLVAPSFSGPPHADYQRLGREGRGHRADHFLHHCLQEVQTLTGADITQVRLFGHSGGAQFAHRYLMAYPHRVAGAVVAGAGWYTFPDTALKFPYGIRASRRLPGVSFNPEAYLNVPVTVLVGARDTEPHKLRSSEQVNLQQGLTRVDRARNWVAAMHAQGAAHGIAPRVDLVELPDAGHSFADLCRSGALVDRVFSTLFDATFKPQTLPNGAAKLAA
jgi:pimeloyl-ACP methyl ester carboxylesterase